MKNVRQKVTRTYPTTWTNNTTRLENLLKEGYKVVHITPLPDGITEYIVEKEVDVKGV